MPSIPSVPLIRARPSLAASSTGVEPGGGQGLGGRHQRTGGVAHLALAHQRQRAVRERRQVARAAQRAVLAHHRRDPVGQQLGQQPRRLEADPGVPGGQRGEPQQHQRAGHLALHLRARSRPRASGPATSAAARASRSGCAGWPARRTRWRCRTTASARRPAPPPPRGPARWRPRRPARGAPARRRGRPPARPRRRAGRCRRGRASWSSAWSWPHPTPATGRRPVRRPSGRLGCETRGWGSSQVSRQDGALRAASGVVDWPHDLRPRPRPAAGRGRRRPPLDDARGEHAGAGGGRGDGARAGLPDPGAARPPGTLPGAGRAGGRGPDRRGDAHPGGVGRGDRPPRRAVRAGDRPGRHHRAPGRWPPWAAAAPRSSR